MNRPDLATDPVLATDKDWQLLKALYLEATTLAAEDRESLFSELGEDRIALIVELKQLLKTGDAVAPTYSRTPSADSIAPNTYQWLLDRVPLDNEVMQLVRAVDMLRLIRLHRLRTQMGAADDAAVDPEAES